MYYMQLLSYIIDGWFGLRRTQTSLQASKVEVGILVWAIGNSHASMMDFNIDMKPQYYKWALNYLKTQLLVVYNKELEKLALLFFYYMYMVKKKE